MSTNIMFSTFNLQRHLENSIYDRYDYLDRSKITLDDHRMNVTDYLYPNFPHLIIDKYVDPILWFRYEDKKYVMKEQLNEYVLRFPKELVDQSIPEEVEYNPRGCLERMYQFYRNELPEFNNQRKFFPKLLEETMDFLIFEYIPENQLREIPTTEMAKFKVIKAINNILKITEDLRPRNNIINWSIRDNEPFYTNITKFVWLNKDSTYKPTLANKLDDIL